MGKGAQTRDAILERAVQLASEVGLDGLTIGRLATLAAFVVGVIPTVPPAFAATSATGPAAQDVSVGLTVDRGDDGAYFVGESMTVCITPSRAATVRLVHGQGTAASSVIFQGQVSEEQCSSGPITPPVGTETLRAEALDDQGNVLASRTVTYRTAMRGASGQPSARTASGRASQDVYGDLMDPCATVRQYAAQLGVTLPMLRQDTRAQQTVQQAWALLVPVLNEIATNPARAEELETLISGQVERSLRGQGGFFNPDQGRQALSAIEGAAQRGLDAWARGEQADPGLLLLASLWGDGQRRSAWRAAAGGATPPMGAGAPTSQGQSYPRCAV